MLALVAETAAVIQAAVVQAVVVQVSEEVLELAQELGWDEEAPAFDAAPMSFEVA